MVKRLWALAALVLLGHPIVKADDQARQAASAVGGAVGNWLKSGLSQSSAPDWLRRTDISIESMDRSKPTWSIETIQPIYQTPRTLTDTVFFQGRWGQRNSDDTVNLGLGYRRLTDEKTWLLGVNSFYDITSKNNHQRLGLGAEAIGQYLSLRTNYYSAISGIRTISEVNGVTTTEKALDGYDYEIDTPVPYAPWMRFSANGFRWKAATSGYPDLVGETYSLRGNFTRTLSLELGHTNDNYNNGRGFVRLNWNFGGIQTGGVTRNLSSGGYSGAAFEARDLTKHTLDKVRRQNDIVVERKSGGVAIARKD